MNGLITVGGGGLLATVVGFMKFSDALDIAFAAFIGVTVAYFVKVLYDKLGLKDGIKKEHLRWVGNLLKYLVSFVKSFKK